MNPPIEMPTTCARLIPNAFSRFTASSAISPIEYAPVSGLFSPASRLSIVTTRNSRANAAMFGSQKRRGAPSPAINSTTGAPSGPLMS